MPEPLRAVRSLAGALVVTGVAVVVLGLAATAILALAPDPASVAPGLTMIAASQAGGLVAATVIALGLRSARGAGTPPASQTVTVHDRAAEAAVRTGRRVRAVALLLLAVLALGAAGWLVAAPGEAVGALTGALVGGQLSVLLVLTAGRLRAAGSSATAGDAADGAGDAAGGAGRRS